MTTAYGPASVQRGPEPTSDEVALWRAFAQDRSLRAREKLFSLYFPFARRIAHRHFLDRRTGDIELADLCQLASAGLLEALDRFDPDLGVPFRGYAKRRITGSILDGVAKMSEVREQVAFRNRARAERIRSLSAEETETLAAPDALQALIELASGLAIGFMLEGTGLYATPENQTTTTTAYDSLAWKETIRRMLKEIEHLPERERTIIRHHYVSGLTFEHIGDLLGLTKGRISQIHRAAIDLLRKRLGQARDFRWEG